MPRSGPLGCTYHDDFERVEEDAGGEFSSTEEISSDEESFSSELEADSELETSEEEEERISSTSQRKGKTVDVPEAVEESVSLNGDKDWQRMRIGFRKSYTIAEKERDGSGDGSTISFRLKEEHPVPPWDKLGESFDIDGNSILGSVRLTQMNSSLPAGVAFIASMVDPKDDSERVTPNLILPNVDRAVSGYLAAGESITSTDEPVTLIEAPVVLKPTFLSTLPEKWSHKAIEEGIQDELGRADMVRLHKKNPVLLSYLLTKRMACDRSGKKWNAGDHVEESGKECFLIPKLEAGKKFGEIVSDSKKNTTAEFFQKNFKMDFVRAWTDGHNESSCASTIGDSTELFDNVTEESKDAMRNAQHSITFEIEADFYTGNLSKSLKF